MRGGKRKSYAKLSTTHGMMRVAWIADKNHFGSRVGKQGQVAWAGRYVEDRITRHDNTRCSRAALSLHIKTMRWAPDFGGPEPYTGIPSDESHVTAVFELW